MIPVPCGDDRIIMKSHNFNWLLLLFPKKNPVHVVNTVVSSYCAVNMVVKATRPRTCLALMHRHVMEHPV
jgi:hypothetical protein